MKAKWIIPMLVVLSLNVNCYSQWIQTDGPYGNVSVSSIISGNSQHYAATSCGLFLTNSTTSQWKLVSDINLRVFDQRGDSIFFGNNGIFLLRLSDENQEAVSKGLFGQIYAIKAADTCLYAGVERLGFYKSNGFSDVWTAHNQGLPTDTFDIPPKYGGGKYYVRYVHSIETYSGRLFCGTNKGVYKSGTENIVWAESSNGLPKQPVNILKAIDNKIFAVINNALWVSSDTGSSWSELFNAPSKIQSVSKFDNIYYVSTSLNGIFNSKGGLTIWNSMNSGLTDLNIRTLQQIDGNLVCGSATGGFHYWNDETWNTNNSGIICSSIYSVSVTSDAIFANDRNHVYISKNGNTWEDISPDVQYDFFCAVVASDDIIFLSVEYNSSSWPFDKPFILYTIDNGQTWLKLNKVPFARDDPYQIYYDSGILYAREDELMYYTNNLGTTWHDLSLPFTFCNGFNDFIVFNGQPFALACGSSELLKLSGSSWILSNTGLPENRNIYSLAHSSDALYAFVSYYGMYVSQDLGLSWVSATKGLTFEWGFSSFAYIDNNIFIGSPKGVNYTDNYGQNWKSLNDGLVNKNVRSIAIFNDTLFAGTARNGIWKHDLKSIHLSSMESQSNEELIIYPNPATYSIAVRLPLALFGEVQIFDMMGRKIFSKPVESSESIDVSGLPNGAYILGVTVMKKVITKKLIISR
jgi:photosystem II stability/assembly factor-like uncharacterized protein